MGTRTVSVAHPSRRRFAPPQDEVKLKGSPMSVLFSSVALGGVTLPNRIVVSPMCQYAAIDGSAQPWHHVHYGMLAMSGAGLLCFEATHVERDGRITQGCAGMYSDENEVAL